MKQPVLVATEGRASSLGAVRIGSALAQRTDRPLHLIAIVPPPFAALATSLDQVLQPLPIEPEHEARLRAAVASQLEAAERRPTMPPVVETAVDSVPLGIVRYAARVNAGIIIAGRSSRHAAEPWLRTETVPKIVHLAHVPVLEVPCEMTALPRRAMVAVDFSEFSLDAAQTTAEMLGNDGDLDLVHVAWAEANPEWEVERVWEETYRVGAEARLRSLAGALTAGRELRVRTHLLTGDPVTEVMRLADSVQPDLIAAGSHAHGFFGRLVMGSVSTQLLRRAGSAVLLTPSRKATVETHAPAGATRFGANAPTTAQTGASANAAGGAS